MKFHSNCSRAKNSVSFAQLFIYGLICGNAAKVSTLPVYSEENTCTFKIKKKYVVRGWYHFFTSAFGK